MQQTILSFQKEYQRLLGSNNMRTECPPGQVARLLYYKLPESIPATESDQSAADLGFRGRNYGPSEPAVD
jgi:hypothetical protein